MTLSPERATSPELIFGLVAPVGVDLELVTDVLEETLLEMHYTAEKETLRLTKLMREVPLPLKLRPEPYVVSIRDRILYANELRKKLGDNALAALAISAIRTFRKTTRDRAARVELPESGSPTVDTADERNEETPLPSQAYIIRQFKRPEEVALFRSVYGRQFILVSAYAPIEARRRRIAELERRTRGGQIGVVEARNMAHELVEQDSIENSDRHGQNVRDAFPLGDVFIDATSRSACELTVRRFIRLLFGNNEITPTHDEYGMYLAKSASLRSSDLSRQVGAAIFRPTGEVLTLGCNEVPRAGGGTYWGGDTPDGRDFVQGHDPNDRFKRELLIDLLNRLKVGSHLSETLLGMTSPQDVAKFLLEDKAIEGVAESRIMDLIEFGRIIHAEMSAICDSSRKGISVEGGTLYCTTFPCHLCAKHIVASGMRRVVFLEPYPKSYALDLHRDSIVLEEKVDSAKVLFEPFIGIAPYRYRELFEKGKRKYSGGDAQAWNTGIRRPMIEVYYPSYFKAETHVVGSLAEELKNIETQAAKLSGNSPVGQESTIDTSAAVGPTPT